jgi:hypothetical protein
LSGCNFLFFPKNFSSSFSIYALIKNLEWNENRFTKYIVYIIGSG